MNALPLIHIKWVEGCCCFDIYSLEHFLDVKRYTILAATALIEARIR